MRVKDNSAGVRNRLILLAMICGCIPYKKLYLVANSKAATNYLTYKRKAKEMIREGIFEEHILSLSNREPVRLLTLAGNPQSRSEYEYDVPRALMEWYDNVTVNDAYQIKVINKDTDQQTRKLRITRNAETLMFFLGLGFDVLKGECSDLKADMQNHKEVFYTSRQVKGIYENEDSPRYKSDFDKNQQLITTRMNGLILTCGGNYQIYNMGRTISSYSYTGESKIREYTNRALAEKNIDRADKAIMLAEKQSIYSRMYMPRHIREERGIDGLIGSYEEVLALTLDKDGQALMKRIAKDKNWKDKIYKTMLTPDQQKNVPIDSPADGVDGNISIFVYCVPDIKRFRRFLNRAKLVEERESYVVMCYEFQKDMLEEVIGKYAKVFTYPFTSE